VGLKLEKWNSDIRLFKNTNGIMVFGYGPPVPGGNGILIIYNLTTLYFLSMHVTYSFIMHTNDEMSQGSYVHNPYMGAMQPIRQVCVCVYVCVFGLYFLTALACNVSNPYTLQPVCVCVWQTNFHYISIKMEIK
jgi:hypothetical protein